MIISLSSLCQYDEILMYVCAIILSLHSGVLIGVALRFGISGSEPQEYFLAELRDNCTNLSEGIFEVGETIQINTRKDNFTCSVSGKVFQDDRGDPIRSTVSGKGRGREGGGGWGGKQEARERGRRLGREEAEMRRKVGAGREEGKNVGLRVKIFCGNVVCRQT